MHQIELVSHYVLTKHIKYLASCTHIARMTLTSDNDVQKFLQKFPNLTVISRKENDHAKPPAGELFKCFKQAFESLPQSQRQTCLAFHGTAEGNIDSICTNGYDPKRRGTSTGQVHGSGEYFATDPSTSMSYCGGKKMILNELLLGQSGVHHTQHGSIIVMKNPDHELPRYVITFQ